VSYHELWAILGSWRREFSAAEFALTFASPDPRKVLHDMVEKGLLERLARGKYRVIPVADYARTRNDVDAGYHLLSEAGMPYALTGVDGVFVWTRGGYNAGRFFGFYPIHVRVFAKDVSRWRGFFSGIGRKSIVAGSRSRETMFGVLYVLYPASRIEAETRNGLEVVPLKDVWEFCRENPYTFGPALKLLPRSRRHARTIAV
jgi:hypothetical protein